MIRRQPLERNLRRRGYQPLYRSGMRCPGCAGGHWHVGRFSAECAHCFTAIPLAPADPPQAEIEADILPFRRRPRAAEAPAGFPLPAGDPVAAADTGPAISFRRSTRPAHLPAEAPSTSEAPAAAPNSAAGAPDPAGRGAG